MKQRAVLLLLLLAACQPQARRALVLDLALFKVQLDGAESARESPFPIRWKYIASDDYTTVPLEEPVELRAGDPKDLDELDLDPESLDRAH